MLHIHEGFYEKILWIITFIMVVPHGCSSLEIGNLASKGVEITIRVLELCDMVWELNTLEIRH